MDSSKLKESSALYIIGRSDLELKMKEFESQGRYLEAHGFLLKIREIKNSSKSTKLTNLSTSQSETVSSNQMYKADRQYETERHRLDTYWTEELENFQRESAIKLKELKERHENELSHAEFKLEEETSKDFKPSSKLLNLMHIEKSLASRKKYIEAHNVQISVKTLVIFIQSQKEELAFQKGRKAKIERQLNILKDKQTIELNALRKKLKTIFLELKSKKDQEDAK